MEITDINMAIETTRGGARTGRGGVRVADTKRTNPRGYPPMSNEPATITTDKVAPTPLPNFIPSHLEMITQSHLTPGPTVPAGDELKLFYPSNFEPDSSESMLIFAPKKFFLPKILDEEQALHISSKLLAYFSRPLTGVYEETVFGRDGETTVMKKPYHAALPLLAEFANMQGLTESELKHAGKEYPLTLGRAIEFARDVVKTNLVRKGLTEKYNPQMVVFTATNETNMKSKTEHTERRVDMNDLLDRIESATQPMSYED